jgi:hypothetical protein
MTHSRLSALPSRMALLALAGMLALAGCNQRHDTVSMEPAPPPAPMAGGAGMKQSRAANVQAEDAAAAAPAQDEMAQRFLAVRQELNVEVPQAQLADAWGQVRDLCATLRCELLTATLLRETPQQPGNALLEMRVAPADVDRLLGTLAGVATIVSQNTISEDKTTEVIDVEARIKNRTDFRDSLRLMLRAPCPTCWRYSARCRTRRPSWTPWPPSASCWSSRPASSTSRSSSRRRGRWYRAAPATAPSAARCAMPAMCWARAWAR